MQFADAMLRFAEDRLVTGAELTALFAGTGIEPSERFEPTQIVEAMDLDQIPLVAARLAALADGTRPVFDWLYDALKLMDQVRDHQLLRGGDPLPIEIRKAAVGLGIIADAAVGMIRNRMMEPLVPYPKRTITVAELQALAMKGARDAAAELGAKPGGDQSQVRGDSPRLE